MGECFITRRGGSGGFSIENSDASLFYAKDEDISPMCYVEKSNVENISAPTSISLKMSNTCYVSLYTSGSQYLTRVHLFNTETSTWTSGAAVAFIGDFDGIGSFSAEKINENVFAICVSYDVTYSSKTHTVINLYKGVINGDAITVNSVNIIDYYGSSYNSYISSRSYLCVLDGYKVAVIHSYYCYQESTYNSNFNYAQASLDISVYDLSTTITRKNTLNLFYQVKTSNTNASIGYQRPMGISAVSSNLIWFVYSDNSGNKYSMAATISENNIITLGTAVSINITDYKAYKADGTKLIYIPVSYLNIISFNNTVFTFGSYYSCSNSSTASACYDDISEEFFVTVSNSVYRMHVTDGSITSLELLTAVQYTVAAGNFIILDITNQEIELYKTSEIFKEFTYRLGKTVVPYSGGNIIGLTQKKLTATEPNNVLVPIV